MQPSNIGAVNKSSSQSAAQTVVNPLQKTAVSVSNDLMANIQFGSFNLAQKVTLQQASLLNQQQLVSLINQQLASVFSVSALKTQLINVPPELAQLVNTWFKQQDKKSLSQLPKQLTSWLAQVISISDKQLLSQLQAMTLKQGALELSFFDAPPILELKLDTTSSAKSNEIAQLLQLLIPIPLNDQSKVTIKEQSQTQQPDQDTKYKFVMNFDLDKLGLFIVEVELQAFEISTICHCQRPALVKLVEQYWPQLQQRLSHFGFNCNNQITLLAESTDTAKSTGLIDIKV